MAALGDTQFLPDYNWQVALALLRCPACARAPHARQPPRRGASGRPLTAAPRALTPPRRLRRRTYWLRY